jgi:hypothetical protein
MTVLYLRIKNDCAFGGIDISSSSSLSSSMLLRSMVLWSISYTSSSPHTAFVVFFVSVRGSISIVTVHKSVIVYMNDGCWLRFREYILLEPTNTIF